MKIIYQGKLYESVLSEKTENKILSTIKSAKKFNPALENKLYRVGGAVRDKMLGVESKDVDYLVTNVAFDDLKSSLETIADSIVSTNVGESMQVIKAIIDNSDEPFDFAIPRTEIYGGSGDHKDIKTFGDPSLSVRDDLARRDLTINAIAYDVETHQFVDPFGGVNDINNKVLRAVGNPDERFKEDLLRILRVLQFANRFGFSIEEKTMEAIKKNVPFLDAITGERILAEFEKAFVKSTKQGNVSFVNMLVDTGIGDQLFGEGFAPIETNLVYGDKWFTNMILLFINGGNYSRLKTANDISTAIQLARSLKTQDPLKVMFNNGRYLQYLKDAFKSMGDESLINKLNSLEGVPLAAKDLAISSQYLMDNGYVGPRLGSLQKNMINEIYLRHIKNDEADLKNYLDSLR